MVKRVLALVLAMMMTITLLSACGEQKVAEATTAEATTAEATTVEATTAEATTTEAAATTVEETAKEPEPVVLDLWVSSREQDAFAEKMEQEFIAKNPHISLNKIVHEGDPGNDWLQGIAAGTAPDIVGVSFNMGPKYIKAGVLLPLNDYVKDWDDYQYFDKPAQQVFTDKKGNIYGVVTGLGNMQFAYNKRLFKEAGLDAPPATWEECIAFAKKLTIPEKQQAGYGLLLAEWPDWWFEWFVWQAGGDLVVKNDDGTAKLTFDDPAVEVAANFYRELAKEKVIQSDVNMKFGDMVGAFATGKIAMMPFAGDWLSWAVSLGAKPEEIGLALMPAGPTGKAGLGNSYGNTHVINPNSSKEKQDAAWEYIKFYNSKYFIIEQLKDRSSKGAVNPVPFTRTDITYADGGVEFSPELEKFLVDSAAASIPEFFGRATFGKYVEAAIQKTTLNLQLDIKTEFAKAQELATKEALEAFNK